LLSSGASMEKLFSNMAKGLFSLIIPLSFISRKKDYPINLRASAREELLVAWLNELIFVHEVENLLFCDFDIKFPNKNEIKAACYGEAIDMKRHRLKMQVKAATYHQLSIWQDKNGLWLARVILDV